MPSNLAIEIFFYTYLAVVTLLFLYGIYGYITFGIYLANRNRSPALPGTLGEAPVVTVQLPIYNERHVVERLLAAAAGLRYPKEKLQIQVLDDSTDETQALARAAVEKFQKQGFWFEIHHRTDRAGYKAGALREGLAKAAGEFVAIFDADFLPQPDFLEKTLPYFSNPRVGLVQTRWGHVNPDYSFLTRAQAMILDAHFAIEQVARNRGGLFMSFNGTAGVFRKRCIEDAGNWHVDTLSEDTDLSCRAYLAGWEFVFLPEVVSPAELPVQIQAFKCQQSRWATGIFQCALKHLPAFFRAPIPWTAKWLAAFQLTSHAAYVLLLIWALLSFPAVLLSDAFPHLGLPTFLMNIYGFAFWGPLLLLAYSQKELYRRWPERLAHLPAVVLVNLGLAPNNAIAVLRAFLKKGRGGAFLRTPKFGITGRGESWQVEGYALGLDWTVLAELFFGSYCLLVLSLAVQKRDYSVIPFLSMFCGGLFYMALLSFLHAAPAARIMAKPGAGFGKPAPLEPVPQKEEKMVWARVIGVMAVCGLTLTLAGCQKPQQPASAIPTEQTDILSSSTSVTDTSATQAVASGTTESVSVSTTAAQAVSTPASETQAQVAVVSPASELPSDQIERTKKIQAALAAAGFYAGSVDGKSGPVTQKAIRDFQTANGLQADGKVGPRTWAKLSQYLVASAAGQSASSASQ